MYVDEQTEAYGNSNRGIPMGIKLPLLSLVISLVIIFVFAIPKYKEAKMAEIQVGLMEKNIELKEDVVKKIANYNEVNKDLKDEDIEKFGKLLPKENNIEEYVANIGNLATINKVVIDGFSAQEANKPTKMVVGGKTLSLNVVNVELFLYGSFIDTMSFLGCLEKSIPLININKLGISEKEKDKNSENSENSENDEEDKGADKNIHMESVISFSFHYL